MSIATVLYLLIIRPLELMFEVIFYLANSVIGNPGLAIIVLSLVVNLLVLPLYIRADRLQKEERDTEKKLDPWVRHIKKSFKGDERFMMLQAYYRENNYKPAYVLKGVLPLMLQVPFFIAAYRFLSGLKILQGFSFGPINDLGLPDGMFNMLGIGINILPILMTIINIASSAVYTKGAPIRTKLQVYGTALIFLFFLYNAPAGLAFYWTLNNMFSLIKNLFYKLQNPVKVIGRISSAIGFVVIGYVLGQDLYSNRQRLFIILMGLLLQLPELIRLIRYRHPISSCKSLTIKNNTGIYFLATLYITFFVGALIPSAVTSSSTTEFIDSVYMNNPIIYVLYSLCISIGFFVVWLGVFYCLSKESHKQIFTYVMWMFSIVSTIDYLFFGTQFGNMSSNLQYDVKPVYGLKGIISNLIIIAVSIAVTYFLYKKYSKFVITLLASLLFVCLGLTLNNAVEMMKDYNHMKSVTQHYNEAASIHLSKNKENVVIIMMDRMIGYFIPYIMEEDKSLYATFDGFKYYPNTVSFGTSTNAGLPPVMGGYEYTPEEMNKRDKEQLMYKHNEALKVMPVLYNNCGFDVAVIDPTYVNYDSFTNLSIFDEYPEIHGYSLADLIRANKKMEGNNLYRNFFCYGFFRVSPLFLQSTIYDNGNYNAMERIGDVSIGAIPIYDENMKKADGLNSDYTIHYGALERLETITQIDESDKGSLVIMNNNTTHSATLLQLPDYTQQEHVDNELFGDSQFVKHDINGRELELTNLDALAHYHVNMSSMKRLGEWMNYLRQQGVYDNTRIIIVSDHAFGLNLDSDLQIEGVDVNGNNGPMDCLWFNCALLVKDFNAKGFSIDETFMTNADVPTLAVKDLIKDPINPFTGKRIDNSYKNEKELKLMVTVVWRVKNNNGNTFVAAPYFTVKENIFNRDNWKYLGYY